MRIKDQDAIRSEMTLTESKYEAFLMDLKDRAWTRLEDLYRMQSKNMHTDPGELREAIEMQSTRWRAICECRREFYEIIKKRIQNQHLN